MRELKLSRGQEIKELLLNVGLPDSKTRILCDHHFPGSRMRFSPLSTETWKKSCNSRETYPWCTKISQNTWNTCSFESTSSLEGGGARSRPRWLRGERELTFQAPALRTLPSTLRVLQRVCRVKPLVCLDLRKCHSETRTLPTVVSGQDKSTC